MELRKVQLTGGSSLTVTLPKAWVTKTSLKPGDVVGLSELADGSLGVQSQIRERRAPQEHTILLEDTDQSYLFRKIIAAYLMGYDVIRLHAHRALTTEARQTIRHAVRRIVGLEIVEEQANSISLQDFLDPREFHIEKAVRRMGILTHSMQQEAVASFRAPRPEVIQSEEDRDSEVDRLYWLVNKQYHAILRDSTYAAKAGYNPGQALNFLLAARLLERTADHADRMAKEAVLLAGVRLPPAFLDRLEKQARRAVDLFQQSLNSFVRRDGRKANELIEESERLQENQRKLLQDAVAIGGEPVAHLAFIIESIGRTAAYAADLGEVAINHDVATVESATQEIPEKLGRALNSRSRT